MVKIEINYGGDAMVAGECDSTGYLALGLAPACRLFRHPYVDPKAIGDAGIGHPQPAKM
jgi:hypothetical protein